MYDTCMKGFMYMICAPFHTIIIEYFIHTSDTLACSLVPFNMMGHFWTVPMGHLIPIV